LNQLRRDGRKIRIYSNELYPPWGVVIVGAKK